MELIEGVAVTQDAASSASAPRAHSASHLSVTLAYLLTVDAPELPVGGSAPA